MLKRKNISQVLILCLLILAVIIGFNFNRVENKTYHNIDELLESDAYSYLSPKVIDYIKDYYEETGAVLLTEKNKQDNVPYLNPEYIKYLESDNQEKYSVVPSNSIMDFKYDEKNSISTKNGTNDTKAENLPSKFDLRDAGGKNYVTPLKNQGSEGLCWAYATNSYLESLLLIKEGKIYDLSEHQLAYATAADGIIESKKIFAGAYKLFEGNNFTNTANTLLNGFGLVEGKWDDHYETEIINKLQLPSSSVFNYNNSIYQVDSIKYIYPTNNSDKNYINAIKKYVMNGGTYIGLSKTPNSSCGINMENGFFYFNNGVCGGNDVGHALHLIGWDDEYTYNICTSDDKTKYSTDISNCSIDNLISGQGAWLLKNSWGEDEKFSYVYVAYESSGLDFGLVDSLSKRDWDNFYDFNAYNKSYQNVNLNFKEKLNSIKINLEFTNTEYEIYITNNKDNPVIDENAIFIGSITSDFWGYYKIDLQNKNIIINPNDYRVIIKHNSYNAFTGKNEEIIGFASDYYVYTNNVDSRINSYSNDLAYDETLENNYNFLAKLYLRNVDDGEKINFIIKDSNNIEVNYKYEVSDNVVFANRVFADLKIDKNLPKGTYNVEALYNDKVINTFKIVIDKDFLETLGAGSLDDPWQINNSVQLSLINKKPYDAYVLTADIDLSYDTSNKNGKFYNHGKGWTPIENFWGYLDGKNYKISGMTIINNEEPDEYADNIDSAGLFKYVGYSSCKLEKCGIENLKLSDVNIDGYFENVGTLATSFSDDYNVELKNIAVESGNINNKFVGNDYLKSSTGGVIGNINITSPSIGLTTSDYATKLSNLYNGANITSKNIAGGIIGSIGKYSQNPEYLDLQNVENTGNITGDNKASGIIGELSIYDKNYKVGWDFSHYIKYAINTGEISGINCSANFFCAGDSHTYESEGEGIKTEEVGGPLFLGYLYGNDDLKYTSAKFEITENNVKNYTAIEMKNKDLYSNWENFDTYWTKLDDRLPILKIADFKYTKTNDIVMKVNNKVNLNNYIEPVGRLDNSKINISDNDIIKYDETTKTITALKEGTTTINVLTNTDGYEGKIKVTVNSNIEIDEDNKKIFLSSSINFKDYQQKLNSIIKVYNNNNEEIVDNDYIATGFKTKIYENDKLIKEYINVLYGDVNGDAKVDISDVAKIYAIVMETKSSDNLITLAGDNNNDNTIDISDVALVYSKIMNDREK